MEKSAHWALVAAVFAASIVGCGFDTGLSDERVAGDGELPSPETTPPPGTESPPPATETPGSPGSPKTPPAPTTPTSGTKLIFVTLERVTGDIKVGGDGGWGPWGGGDDGEEAVGRDAADAICNSEAKAAKLPGTYLAWLSKEGEDAIARIPESPAGWSLPTGALVFPNRAHIAAGLGPQTLIIVHANGLPILGSTDVWTSTHEKGTALNPSCGGWKSTSGTGVSGALYYTHKKWTNNASDTCSSQRRLICFQK